MRRSFFSSSAGISRFVIGTVIGLGLNACNQQDAVVPAEVAKTATQTNTGLCEGFGPQTPRDISNAAGTNLADFAYAPPASEMNLCNIHTHTNAEHKGPGFEVFAGEGASGGYQCNETEALTAAETAPYDGKAYYKAVSIRHVISCRGKGSALAYPIHANPRAYGSRHRLSLWLMILRHWILRILIMSVRPQMVYIVPRLYRQIQVVL